MFILTKTVKDVRRYFVRIKNNEQRQVDNSANILKAHLFVTREDAQRFVLHHPALYGYAIVPRQPELQHPLIGKYVIYRAQGTAIPGEVTAVKPGPVIYDQTMQISDPAAYRSSLRFRIKPATGKAFWTRAMPDNQLPQSIREAV